MENKTMQQMQQEYDIKQETIVRVREMFPNVQFPDIEEHLLAHYQLGNMENAHIMNNRRLIVGNYNNDMYEFGIISKEYKVITHEETIASLIDVLPEFPEYGKPEINVNILNHGEKMRLIVDFPEAPKIEVAKKDPVVIRITGQNSYDLAWEFSIGVEGFCEICAIGLMGWKSLEKYNKRHNSGLFLNQSRKVLAQGMTAFSEQTEIWKLWADKMLPTPTFMKVIEGLPFGERHTEKILELPQTQKNETLKTLGEKNKASIWDVNLSVTQFLTHEIKSEAVRVDKGKKVAKYLENIANVA
jgi:hypothetical protein